MLKFRSQVDVVGVLILVGASIAIGLSFLVLVTSHVSSIVGEGELRNALYNEQSLLVLYREYENGTHVCIGFLRLEPSAVSYALAYIVDGEVRNDAVSIPGFRGHLVRRVTTGVYCLAGGDYYPCSREVREILYLPGELVADYARRGLPGLVCVERLGREGRLVFFTVAGQELYEVGGVVVRG